MYNHLLWPILELVRQVWSSRDPNFRTAFTFPQVLKRPMPGGRFLSMQGWSAWIESGYVGGWAATIGCSALALAVLISDDLAVSSIDTNG